LQEERIEMEEEKINRGKVDEDEEI
jgi:hypothetical protein